MSSRQDAAAAADETSPSGATTMMSHRYLFKPSRDDRVMMETFIDVAPSLEHDAEV
jgi:hypothetical protein